MTTKRDRDRSIETLLRQLPAEPGRSGASDAHLDAETLAAWADGGLSDGDLAVAEAHAADCSWCQATLAAFIKTAGLSPAPRAWWQRDWNLGWLVPLAAGAAAVAIWVAVPRQGPSSSLDSAVRPATVSEPTESAKSASSARRRDAPAPPAGFAGGARSSRPTAAQTPAEAQTEARREEANAAPPPPAALDLRRKEEFSDEKKTLAEQSSVADSVERIVPSAAPPAPAAVTAPGERQALSKDRAVAGVLESASRIGGAQEIVSSDPAIRWRVGRAGLIQRSADRGSTWEVLQTGVTADLLAGMSSSPSICWVVGRAGTVLRALDGRRFEPVAFPEKVDLAAVRVTDAQNVVVTAVDGRAFRTADGGTTWAQNR